MFSRSPNGLGRGFWPVFRRRSRRGAFAVGLALDDELMGAMRESVEGALSQHRFIKDCHPLLHSAVGGDDGGTAGVAFDQQIIRVGSGLAGKFLECEIIHDEHSGLRKLRSSRSKELSARERARIFKSRSARRNSTR